MAPKLTKEEGEEGKTMKSVETVLSGDQPKLAQVLVCWPPAARHPIHRTEEPSGAV